jgi:crotonyl-CoA carboxylase/reductase
MISAGWSAWGDPTREWRHGPYAVGEIPPNFVPKAMHASSRERAAPRRPCSLKSVPTNVLVLVMAAGVNYNGVWAGSASRSRPFDVPQATLPHRGLRCLGHRLGRRRAVKRWKVGDEVVIHCNQDDGDDEECNGGDPMFSPSQRIWGYETPDGSFAQFCRVQARQLMPRPST